MSKELNIDTLAFCMASSRDKCGKSQKHMAKAMNRSVGTIQNWENGYSCPNVIEVMDWFRELGLNPMRAIMECLHPEIYHGISANDDTDRIRQGLSAWVNNIATDDEIRKISYCVYGNTGSSWHSQINEMCALNHLPISDRIVIAEIIQSLYQIKDSQNALVGTEHISPDMDNFHKAIETCKKAVLDGKSEYSMH